MEHMYEGCILYMYKGGEEGLGVLLLTTTSCCDGVNDLIFGFSFFLDRQWAAFYLGHDDTTFF